MGNRLKGRIKKVEDSWGIIVLPNFERMTQAQMDAWFRNATDEDMNQVYKKLMATVRGCKSWQVENMDTLTDEEIETNLRQAGLVICNGQDLS